MNRWLLFLGGAALFVASCKDSPNNPEIDLGFDYLPLKVGSVLEYDVDSIVYDEFTATVDTFSFKLREVCTDTFSDLEDRLAYRFERLIKRDDTSDYAFHSTFYLVTDGVRTERFENNLRTVQLVYPPVLGEDWDANVFNTLSPSDREFESVDASYSQGELAFDSTIHVILENDTDNFVIKRFSEERYAKHVGLITKRYFDIETQ